MKTHIPIVGLLFLAICPLQAAWETVQHQDREYVTARSIMNFYGFDEMDRKGDFLHLRSKAVTMKFTVGGREAYLNDVKFVFSTEIVPHEDRYLVSRIDLSKVIDPVLRPTTIKDAKPFTTVIIDPGHGGKDSGAVNKHGKEKDYALSMARRLQKELEKRGIKAVLTRDDDLMVSLADRVKFANKIDDAVFVSIHLDSSKDKENQGIQTYVLSPAGVGAQGDLKAQKGNAQDSANIALATAVHSACVVNTRGIDGGIRRARFSVLTGAKHPAILLEAGNMNDPVEAERVHAPKYQAAVVDAIAEAIVKYRLAVR